MLCPRNYFYYNVFAGMVFWGESLLLWGSTTWAQIWILCYTGYSPGKYTQMGEWKSTSHSHRTLGVEKMFLIFSSNALFNNSARGQVGLIWWNSSVTRGTDRIDSYTTFSQILISILLPKIHSYTVKWMRRTKPWDLNIGIFAVITDGKSR